MASNIFRLSLVSLVLLLVNTAASSKIQPSLQRSLLHKGGKANVLISFQTGTENALNQATKYLSVHSTHAERTTTVYRSLVQNAADSQDSMLRFLKIKYPFLISESFWITNQVYIKGVDRKVLEELIDNFPEVKTIEEEEVTHIRNFMDSRSESYSPVDGNQNKDLGWGYQKLRVPEVWEMEGITKGEGLIVGNIDTGVRGSHELLRNKWVGLSENGWYDPEGKTYVPHDRYNHGTGNIATMLGDNGIGAVPNARWLACKGYRDDGGGYTSTFLACGQYILCPTNYQGGNANCTKAPHVVSNSWGFNGGDQFTAYLKAWDAAGIVASFAAGNQYYCQRIYNPADRPLALAVGALDRDDSLMGYSSKGPSVTGVLKPEISAPGNQIYTASAASDNAYMYAGGTSFACPVTTGVLALLKDFDRNLTQKRATELLTKTAVKNKPTGKSCGGIPDSVFPNNHIGHGRVDAFGAIQLLKEQILNKINID